jgi:hypothetical protein
MRTQRRFGPGPRATWAALAIVAATAPAGAQPTAPGYTLCDYAIGFTNAVTMAWAPGGVLFVAHEDNGTPTRIYRVGPGGSPITLYGDTDLPDPDSIAFDASGIVSGVPGTVLVGGICSPVPEGCIWAVRPNQTTFTRFGPSTALGNTSMIRIDSTGRMVFTGNAGLVMVSRGLLPTTLFIVPGSPFGIGIDAADRIYTASSDGVIRLHSAAGVLINDSFASGFFGLALAVGPGGVWGTDLYGVEISSGGRLLRFNAATGEPTVLGTGFNASDIVFGPDGEMYVTTRTFPVSGASAVLRIRPCRANWNGRGCVDSQDFFDFVNDFFAGNADYNQVNGTNSQDFFDFVNDFFAGCP